MHVFVLSLANQDFSFIGKSGELGGGGEWKVGVGGGGRRGADCTCMLISMDKFKRD